MKNIIMNYTILIKKKCFSEESAFGLTVALLKLRNFQWCLYSENMGLTRSK
jgi:hypothetical protein